MLEAVAIVLSAAGRTAITAVATEPGRPRLEGRGNGATRSQRAQGAGAAAALPS